ncbi:MAG TPA: hypothetical protein VGS07_30315 [Thermoanaerobaculia bacterium]|jgi:hypothetical protein|nr:hypothetical protein [Thermoanaerobaculia bacterium]
MPELTQQCTPPPSPPEHAVSPPVIDPERWEDFPCFREIFLVMFTDARANEAMRRFGHLQYEMVIETWGQWPDHREGIFPAEMRAAVADLRHVQRHLRYVLEWAGGGTTYSPLGMAYSRLARDCGGEVEEIAAAIEAAMADPRGTIERHRVLLDAAAGLRPREVADARQS